MTERGVSETAISYDENIQDEDPEFIDLVHDVTASEQGYGDDDWMEGME